MELHKQSALEIKSLVVQNKITVCETVAGLFRHIEKTEPSIKAFLTLTKDFALEQARRVDEKVKSGGKLGLLAGIPVAVKDNICTDGIKTTCGSKILNNFTPTYDAFVIKRIKEEDGIIIGKTNLDEFAMGSSCENSAFGPTHNPRDLERVPGGSSGGSAAAVAADMSPLALGSDTGGSIRQPASFCGIVGLKPTYGLVSRYGLVAFASSLDQIGPMAKNVFDAALLLQAIAGYDKQDSTSVNAEIPDYLNEIKKDIKGAKIGIPREYFDEGVEKDIRDAVLKRIKELGVETVDISLPNTGYGIATYYIVAPSEASSNLARYDGTIYGNRVGGYNGLKEMLSKTRSERFGREIKRRIMLGTFALSSGYYDAYYLRALKIRRLIKNDFDRAFEQVDAIVGPTSPVAPFKLGENINDPLKMYLSDLLTVTANLAGIPGISIPCGKDSNNLPIGLQILGRPFTEAFLLRLARAFEIVR